MPRNTSNLLRGGPGRKKGSKDAIPRTFKASVRAVYEEILSEDPDVLKTAILKGLQDRRSKDRFPYVRMLAEMQGELKQIVRLEEVPTFRLVRDDSGG